MRARTRGPAVVGSSPSTSLVARTSGSPSALIAQLVDEHGVSADELQTLAKELKARPEEEPPPRAWEVLMKSRLYKAQAPSELSGRLTCI